MTTSPSSTPSSTGQAADAVPTSLACAGLLAGRASPPAGLVALPHLGVIRARGEDAATFLQGQLSNDVQLLKPGQARLAAYCSPKGRVLASFVVYKQPSADGAPPDLLLICQRDLLAATLKRLSMFVLRAKAKLSDASEEVIVHGAVGDLPALTELASQPWSTVSAQGPGFAAIRLYPAAGLPRALVLAQADALPVQPAALGVEDWHWLDTLAGVPLIASGAADQFVPQMLNYESTGGVSFKKGCYPGQEVVARSQFRGSLKRRLYVVRASSPLRIGQDVLQGPDASQITGLVVQAAAVTLSVGGSEAVEWFANVSVQIAAAESAEGLYVQGDDGQLAPLQVLERPYTLLEDI